MRKNQTSILETSSTLDAFLGCRLATHDKPATLVVHRTLLSRLSTVPVLVARQPRRSCAIATHLVLEEGIPDIFRHCGHSQNVILTLLVSLGVDATEEHIPIVPNRPESARRELALPWIRTHSGYLLEQLHPSLVLVPVQY